MDLSLQKNRDFKITCHSFDASSHWHTKISTASTFVCVCVKRKFPRLNASPFSAFIEVLRISSKSSSIRWDWNPNRWHFLCYFFTAWQLQKQLYQQLQKSRQKAGWQAKLLRLARRRRAPKKVLKYILGQNFANNEEAFKAQCLWFLPKNVQQLKTKTNVPIYSIVFLCKAQKRTLV